jgi:hypothetical protein
MLWLALLAMAMAALAPTLSHALALASDESGATMVCSAHGARWVDADGRSSTPPANSAPLADGTAKHCPFCLLAGQSMAPPPAGLALTLSPLWHGLVPERFLTAEHTPHAWCAAQPRAPPRQA